MTPNSPTFGRSHGFLPDELPGLDTLTELALDLRWSWNHAADTLWQQLDAELWARTHNPWVVLQTASREALELRLADPAFRAQMAALTTQKQQATDRPKWFQAQHPNSPLPAWPTSAWSIC